MVHRLTNVGPANGTRSSLRRNIPIPLTLSTSSSHDSWTRCHPGSAPLARRSFAARGFLGRQDEVGQPTSGSIQDASHGHELVMDQSHVCSAATSLNTLLGATDSAR